MNIMTENTKGSYNPMKTVNGVTAYMSSNIYDKRDITITDFVGQGESYRQVKEPKIIINCGDESLTFNSLEELMSALNPPLREKTLTLFHGTSSERVPSILKDGLREPYLTNSWELAVYYAQEEVSEVGGEVQILRMEVSSKDLRVDYPSLEEPVSYDEFDSGTLEIVVETMYGVLSESNPGWVKNGLLIIPENQYYVSLETVGSCRSAIDISPEKITIAEDED